MSGLHSRLWLAIRFFDLPLTALKITDALTKPVVVIEKKRVVFANSLAADAGACVGMDMTTAQLLSGCDVVERDKTQEEKALHQLSEQLYQFTPHIDRYWSKESAQSGVLLEISSCLHLFGGLTLLCENIFHYISHTPYHIEHGLAHSAKAAWYLSFTRYDITGDETKSLFIERVNSLPIELLCDFPKAMESLAKTGFVTFGDLAKQIQGKSLSSFTKRLGNEFTDVLCELYDIDQNFQQGALFEKPRDSYQPDEWFEKELHFEYPVTLVEQLKPAIETLLQALSDYLRKRQQQCQSIEWCIADIYHKKELIHVNSDTPQSHWHLLYDLSVIQFDNTVLPFEVDTIRLTCRYSLALQQHSQLLDFDNSRRKSTLQDFAVTIAKLKARLGEGAVYKLGYHDSRVPELTNVMVALAEKCYQHLPDIHAKALRPVWLLTPPEVIEERHHRLYWQGYLVLLVGPERIIGDWWEQPVARDYYLAKRHDNVPVWIFFNLYDKQWYAHGVFA